MKFNHLFYNSEVNFKDLSFKRIFLSVLLGLASAIIIYSFFYMLREMDRILFLDFENRPHIIPESDRNAYNLFFAAIAMILGNSITINFLLSRPQKVFSTRNIKRHRILNDNTFLGFNFIHWFAKLWFLFCMFAWLSMGSKFVDNFMLPSVLVIIVLYLDCWKTLITVIKKHRWKIQLLHLAGYMILTFSLSKLNLVTIKVLIISN